MIDIACYDKSARPTCFNHINHIASIGNYIQYKVYDKILNPLPNFNGAAMEVWE